MSNFNFVADITKFDPDTTRYVGENALVLIDCTRLVSESTQVMESKLRGEWGMDRFQFFSGLSTQAFVAGNERFLLVSFRGTEPANLYDWYRDIDLIFTDGPAGKVHRGFHKAFFEVWDGDGGLKAKILEFRDQAQTVWIGGHSLGGALGTLAVAYLRIKDKLPVNGLYTIGQPRIGNGAFARAFASEFPDRAFRFVNNNDIVTRIPLWLAGYRHIGNLLYFDEDGNLLDSLSPWRMLRDGLEGAYRDIGEPGPDAFKDHFSDGYLRLIEKNRGVKTRWS